MQDSAVHDSAMRSFGGWPDDGQLRRLVRLCARLTGDVGAAEDLAQETMVEAWRHRARLTDPEGLDRWLSAIARNVCNRWTRQRGREQARTARAAVYEASGHVGADAGLELRLERSELTDFLERALAELPPQTREVLVERYVHESTNREIALRLGLSPDAVSMRLHRGRLVLRRLLTNELRAESAAYGLHGSASDAWSSTRIWCTSCGDRTLVMRRTQDAHEVAFRCPGCDPVPGTVGTALSLRNPVFAAIVEGVVRPTAILARLARWSQPYYAGGAGSTVRCTGCGQPARVRRYLRRGVAADQLHGTGLSVACPCGEGVSSSLGALALHLPEVRVFRREHPRVRGLPPRAVEADGAPALVVGYRDLHGASGVDVVFGRDTLDVRRVAATGVGR